jgi:hypothetical protein
MSGDASVADRLVRDELYRSGRFLDLGVRHEADGTARPTDRGNTLRMCFMACMGAADDLGNFEANPGDLVRLWRDILPVASLTTVDEVFRELVGADLLRQYLSDGKRYGHIPRWRQRIRFIKHSHPRPPEGIECFEIKDKLSETPDSSQTGVRPKTARARAEVKGSEEKGREGNNNKVKSSTTGSDDPSSPASKGAKPLPEIPASSRAWNAYKTVYTIRYGAAPVRNAKTNGQLAQLVARLGKEDAVHVAAHYVSSENARYVASGHAIGELLRDCEKLRTEWATGAKEKGARRENIHDTRAETLAGLTGGGS